MKKDIKPSSKTTTSWGGVADWYSNYLETTEDSYQRAVILPNLLRLLALKKGMRLIDIACGQGFFGREFAKAGASVVGADISKELILEAKRLSSKDMEFHVAPARALSFAKNSSYEVATIILALQNIENISEVFSEVGRVLVPGGRLLLVMVHPAFRVPKKTSWGFDEKIGVQYRRVDGYLSAGKSEIVVHPGQKNSEVTISYHRSLQDISKAVAKSGLLISRIEEWISHKKSEKGPRQVAEDTARREIPLFLMMEVRKF
ncbi:MAG: class I SAM-dependent methyltransferase [Patescibacteria group bacterium]